MSSWQTPKTKLVNRPGVLGWLGFKHYVAWTEGEVFTAQQHNNRVTSLTAAPSPYERKDLETKLIGLVE